MSDRLRLDKLSLLQKHSKAKIFIIATISSNEKRVEKKKEKGYKIIELKGKDMFYEIFGYVNIVCNQ